MSGSQTIRSIKARQVWDSRGRPTVEAEVTLESGIVRRSIAPSGASTGRLEALDLRDGGSRLGGYGVNTALSAVNTRIAPRLAGMDASDQAIIDHALIDLDGTPQKTVLGGNACIAVSVAIAAAAAAAKDIPLWQHLRMLAGADVHAAYLPLPMIQIFGGGAHAGRRIEIQDFLVIARTAANFAEAVEITAEIYLSATTLMKAERSLSGVADEGGLWPDFDSSEQALELLTRAIARAGFKPGDVGIAIDVAASQFFYNGRYDLSPEKRGLSSEDMIAILTTWCDNYPIVSLEDPLSEDDDRGFVAITKTLGERCRIVGDDYLATDTDRIIRSAALGACNTALLKSNQCGTVTELIAASAAARKFGWNTIMSGRSGESEDVALSHFAVGLIADHVKVGSMTRSERTAKWNELIRIEEAFSP